MRIQTTISSANNNLLIPINDLPTLQTNVRQHLGLADEFWDNHILYAWTEGVNEASRRHCVKPFVHVMLSNEATEAVASQWTFLPYVFSLGSTGRGMDWMVALHTDSFVRPQEFAFVENRKLLRVDSDSAGFIAWLRERMFVQFDEVPVGYVASVPADGPATPAQFGKNYLPSQVAEVSEHGAIFRIEVPNALAKYHTDTSVSVDADQLARVTGDGLQVREILAKTMPTGYEKVMPIRTDEILKKLVLDESESGLPVELLPFVSSGCRASLRHNDLTVELGEAQGRTFVAAIHDSTGSLALEAGIARDVTLLINDAIARKRSADEHYKAMEEDPKRCNMHLLEAASWPTLPGWVLNALQPLQEVMPRLQIHFTEEEGLIKILDERGYMLTQSEGIGREIAAAIRDARASRQVVRVTPVGSQLKARAEKLRVDVKANRRMAKDGVHVCKLDGIPKVYHYPPYSSGLRSHLGDILTKLALDMQLVLLTDSNMQQLYALADAEGEEISFSRGVGHDMAATFEIS